MTSFIFDVLKDLQNKGVNIPETTFILPSKRAGLFLKHQLPKICKQTIFSPRIISIEEFVEELSELKSISNTELLFEFYNCYKALNKPERTDSFEVFSKWAQILLQDFNEIDRYYIPHIHIFDYLAAIKEIETDHWSLEENQTEFIKNYLEFWYGLPILYRSFTNQLRTKNIGYQGLIYREAVENLDKYLDNNSENKYVFLGFNALNTCEETIIQKLLKNNSATIYWDIDTAFIENPKHDAALFTRQHKPNWSYFKSHPFNWFTNNYKQPKNISVYGIPKNIGQAKHIGSLLKELQLENPLLEKTAVILGDENLLVPVLNSLPIGIGPLNITMGFPLKSIPLASLFEALFHLHKTNKESFYYKDALKIISHQYIRPLLQSQDIDYASKIIETIDGNNIIYLNAQRIKELFPETLQTIADLLFNLWDSSITKVLDNCFQLILTIKGHLDQNKEDNLLSLEYLYRFHNLFNELNRLNSTYNHITDISTLFNIYKELLSSETLDFQGEPLEGLQIMGMLESRVLDYDTVIIASVNEGILPSGKSNNSFIPFDVKIENKLPTYKEKDAVYTYHFYRLLQRAKNVHILYNTEADILTGGEKSRFITQLELENIHEIKHHILAPQVPVIISELNSVEKTPELLNELKKIAEKGFSPSSLTSYIRNPIDFYHQKILKIKEHNDVEETVAANTLGTVVHNTLEDFYKPLINTFLTVEIIENLKQNITKVVTQHFKNEYKEGDITMGKNLIIFEIAKRYVLNFLNTEVADLKAGNKIKILAIEANNLVTLDIPELDFPVKLTGKVDRVDQRNGIIRIIDYKSGRVEKNQVEVINWEDLITDYKKYSKSFQVLSYALMMKLSNKITLPVEAGIISFKNLNAGFIKFTKKDKAGNGAKKDTLITQETINNFNKPLKILILEICNPDIPFTEKEI
ncbi:PD-(D/E)XK nuclease family protein [Gaetbulibacter saemankumensis]|uniref:PD-(D/E)XK nuclease family protein n=1 Tax=Gaetbulibacter saemankumensis TaxID=311208 RepID=UPI00041ADC1F|nr:PD-(D/E)XK nuclease family protein [Gaetbulibacter saemankumensis]